MLFGTKTCLTEKKVLWVQDFVVSYSLINIVVKCFYPSAKSVLFVSQRTDITSVLCNIQAHNLQSRHVASHDVNYWPQDKENNYYTVLPPVAQRHLTQVTKLSVHFMVMNVHYFFIAYICAAIPTEPQTE